MSDDALPSPSSARHHARLWRWLLWLTLLVYFVFFLMLNISRLWGFGFSLVDLGAYDQVLWNLTHGAGHRPTFTITYPYNPDTHWLSFHFSLLTFAVVGPIYYFLPHVELLEIIHVAAMTGAAIPLYAACRNIAGKPRDAYLWALIFLLNPFQISAIMFSFQDMSLATPVMTLGLWAVTAKNRRALLLSCLGLVLAKEQLGIAVAGFGMLWGWKHKDWRTGIWLAAGGFGAFYLIVFQFMPYFRGGGLSYFLSSGNYPREMTYNRYQWLSLPFPEMIDKFAGILLSEQCKAFLFLLLMPFCLFQLIGLPFLLPAAADMAAMLLSESIVPRSFGVYYTSCVVPALTVAACAGAAQVASWMRHLWKVAWLTFFSLIALGVTLCFTLVVATPKIPESMMLFSDPSMAWAASPSFQRLEAFLPPDAPLIVSEEIGPLLDHRREIYSVESSKVPDTLEYLIAMRLQSPAFFLIAKPYKLSPVAGVQIMLDNPDWGVVFWDDPFLVLKHGAGNVVDKSVIYQRLDELKESDALVVEEYKKLHPEGDPLGNPIDNPSAAQ